jgi:hypothetical protein
MHLQQLLLAEAAVEPEVYHQIIVMEQGLLVEQEELGVMVEVQHLLQVCKEQPTVVVAEAVENKMKPLVQVVQV